MKLDTKIKVTSVTVTLEVGYDNLENSGINW